MAEKSNREGQIIILSGPSGVGKSTICKELVRQLDDVCLSVSMTTRDKAETEIDGKDYWFVTKEEFQKRIDKNLFLEYAKVFGNLYGTPKDKVKQMLGKGKTVILEIDVKGARQVKQLCPKAKMVFILPPRQKDLAERMNNRARGEDAEAKDKRLNGAGEEIAAAWEYYEYMIINDSLQRAVDEVMQIIEQKNGDRQ